MRSSLRLLEKSTKASQKLFKDAFGEEAEHAASTQSKPLRLSAQDSHIHSTNAWDGDEHPHDTTLRMLMDSRKPLRSGTKGPYGDSKLKAVQQPTPLSPTDNLIPSNPNFMPWDAEYVYPSHASGSTQPSIYRARKLESQALEKMQGMQLDSKTKAVIRDTKKSKAKVRRLVNAREGALDYSLTGSLDDIQNKAQHQSRPRPQSLQAWQSLVEEQIEGAQRKGQFSNLEGRGKPLASVSESNPFISREEFLMNRIIGNQGAVPAFVELQMSMEGEVTSFRNYLREEYTKRGVRYIAKDSSSEIISKFRDREWEERQRSYHTILVDRVNSAIKSYNAIAPAFSRRGLLLLDAEVERAREAAVPVIAVSLRHHVDASPEQPQQRKPSTLIGKMREIFGGV